MPFILALVCVLSWLVLGCAPEASPPASTSPPAKAGSAPATPEAGYDQILAELTQALRKYSAEKRQVPASLNELTGAGYIRKLPPPPPGKTFGIDSKNLRVILK